MGLKKKKFHTSLIKIFVSKNQRKSLNNKIGINFVLFKKKKKNTSIREDDYTKSRGKKIVPFLFFLLLEKILIMQQRKFNSHYEIETCC